MKDTGVHVLLNTEFKPEDKDGYDEIFVATGARERKLPTPGFEQPAVRYAVDVLRNQNIQDQNVVIVGGGLTGCELAYDLTRKNKKVTLVETCPTILNVEGLSAANYNCLLDLMEYYKVDILKNSKVVKYKDGKAYIETVTYNEPNIRGRALNQSLQGIHRDIKSVEADTVIETGIILKHREIRGACSRYCRLPDFLWFSGNWSMIERQKKPHKIKLLTFRAFIFDQ